MHRPEDKAWERIRVGLELLIEAENSLAALVRNLEEVIADYEKARSALRRSRSRGKAPRKRQ